MSDRIEITTYINNVPVETQIHPGHYNCMKIAYNKVKDGLAEAEDICRRPDEADPEGFE
jgi:hypothetical protein